MTNIPKLKTPLEIAKSDVKIAPEPYIGANQTCRNCNSPLREGESILCRNCQSKERINENEIKYESKYKKDNLKMAEQPVETEATEEEVKEEESEEADE